MYSVGIIVLNYGISFYVDMTTYGSDWFECAGILNHYVVLFELTIVGQSYFKNKLIGKRIRSVMMRDRDGGTQRIK